tara:strand:- start:1148 stop:1483 length:336 start_codon:yes stop_codon:yes gene_type:complete
LIICLALAFTALVVTGFGAARAMDGMHGHAAITLLGSGSPVDAAHHAPADHDRLDHCKSGHAVGCGFAGAALSPGERVGVRPIRRQNAFPRQEQAPRAVWAMLPERPPNRA